MSQPLHRERCAARCSCRYRVVPYGLRSAERCRHHYRLGMTPMITQGGTRLQPHFGVPLDPICYLYKCYMVAILDILNRCGHLMTCEP